jgi:hypothetical protein
MVVALRHYSPVASDPGLGLGWISEETGSGGFVAEGGGGIFTFQQLTELSIATTIRAFISNGSKLAPSTGFPNDSWSR